jgi:hypothetical protein
VEGLKNNSMKNYFLFLFSCLSGTLVFGQHDNDHRNPPTTVTHSWQRDYPNQQSVQWDLRNNQWHTTYRDNEHNNRNVDVYYDRNGKRRYWQTEWDRNDLPPSVQNRIRSKYHVNNYSAYRVERPGGKYYFQISLGKNRKIYLDERGRETSRFY